MNGIALQVQKQPIRAQSIAKLDALYRACTVLLSGHIEGFVESLCCIALDRIHSQRLPKDKLSPAFGYYFSKDIIAEVKDAQDPKVLAEKIRTLWIRDSDIWATDAHFQIPLPANRFVHGFANPKVDDIRKLMNRFGYTDYLNDLAHKLTRDYQLCKNMIDHIVDERNKIAHGELGVSGTPQDVVNMVALTRVYCRATDEVVAVWFKGHGCAIR